MHLHLERKGFTGGFHGPRLVRTVVTPFPRWISSALLAAKSIGGASWGPTGSSYPCVTSQALQKGEAEGHIALD